MKLLSAIVLVACLVGNAAQAQETATPQESPQAAGKVANADFCFFSTEPPSDVKYSVLEDVKVGKQAYGSVAEMLPDLVDEAHAVGGDAIIHYAGSQRFGFWPWRMVRPIVRGTAVRWNGPTPDCAAVGGTTMSVIIATDTAPTK